MKTGEDIKNRALILLNYTDQDGNADNSMFADLSKRSLPLVNQIYAELWYMVEREPFVPLPSLTEPLMLPQRILDEVMPYGVAMLMSQTIGDADNQSLFSLLYSKKRASVPCPSRRHDVLPHV